MRRLVERLPILVVGVFTISILASLVWLPFGGTQWYHAAMARIAAPEDDAAARHYIELFRTKDYLAINESVDPRIRQPVDSATYEQVSSALTGVRPQRIELVGFHKYWTADKTVCDAVYEMQFARWWTIADVDFAWVNGQTELTGFHANRLSEPLERTNAFLAPGKPPIRYLWLLAVTAFMFIQVYTLFVCAAAPNVRWRWLWLLAIIIGVCKVMVNWTTGVYAIKLVFIGFPIAGANSAGPYAPWILYLTVPIGLIAFWTFRPHDAAAANKPSIVLMNEGGP